MVVNRDSLRLFSGTNGYVGLYERFEQQEAIVPGAEVLTAAGRDPEKPAFVAYRLGDGIVVRAGSPEWNPSLASTADAIEVTRNVWSFLSR